MSLFRDLFEFFTFEDRNNNMYNIYTKMHVKYIIVIYNINIKLYRYIIVVTLCDNYRLYYMLFMAHIFI